jgi:hypothetical protein
MDGIEEAGEGLPLSPADSNEGSEPPALGLGIR